MNSACCSIDRWWFSSRRVVMLSLSWKGSKGTGMPWGMYWGPLAADVRGTEAMRALPKVETSICLLSMLKTRYRHYGGNLPHESSHQSWSHHLRWQLERRRAWCHISNLLMILLIPLTLKLAVEIPAVMLLTPLILSLKVKKMKN